MHDNCQHEKPTDDDCRQCENYEDTGLFVQDIGGPFMDTLKGYLETQDGGVLKNILISDQFIAFCKYINLLMRGLDKRTLLLDMLGVQLDYYPAVQIGVVIGMMVACGGYTPEVTYKLLSKHETGDVAGDVEKYLEGLNESGS